MNLTAWFIRHQTDIHVFLVFFLSSILSPVNSSRYLCQMLSTIFFAIELPQKNLLQPVYWAIAEVTLRSEPQDISLSEGLSFSEIQWTCT